MAREINRRHIIAVVREIAGLQGPYRVVHAGAMQKHHHRLPRDPGAAAGGGENRFAVNRHLHRLCSPGGGFESLGQIARQIVDIFSKPTDRRTKSSVRPTLCMVAASIC